MSGTSSRVPKTSRWLENNVALTMCKDPAEMKREVMALQNMETGRRCHRIENRPADLADASQQSSYQRSSHANSSSRTYSADPQGPMSVSSIAVRPFVGSMCKKKNMNSGARAARCRSGSASSEVAGDGLGDVDEVSGGFIRQTDGLASQLADLDVDVLGTM
eukprot:2348870-Heterocapsa_arctica.AAC.1